MIINIIILVRVRNKEIRLGKMYLKYESDRELKDMKEMAIWLKIKQSINLKEW